MARTKPPIRRLSDLQPGDQADFFALLADRSKGSTRDAKPYYVCRFRDAKRTATYMAWADGPFFDACQNEWRPGQFFKLRATYGEHEKYGPQLEVANIRPATDTDRADGFDPAEFADRSRFDPAAQFAELRALTEAQIADEPLRRLTIGLLDSHADVLKHIPASPRNHFAFVGGWAEHTLSVTKSCLWLADRYLAHYSDLKPPLNRDLVVAGAVLHDIGRAVELDSAVPAQPTVPGRLLGHLFLGRDLVRDAAREQGDVNPDLVQLLEHLIISHLNLPEWGSPRLPLIPESLILHHADDLDAKLELYARCLTNDKADGPFTDRDPVLGRNLFKGRTV